MPSRHPPPGEVLEGKYRIERVLGEGGMSTVVKATHLLRRAPVALKFLSAEVRSKPGAEERFMNEAVAASRIDSDHVVKIFDVSRLPDGAPYLVMEFLEGRDLGELLQREGPRLPAPRAVHFVLQVLRALQTAHAAGIVHRDVKPANCFVTEKDGETDFVKVIDFGISKLRRPDEEAQALTATNAIFGTPLYMSPEQAQWSRNVDLRTDLYSTGAILYELLSGRTTFTTDSDQSILFQLFSNEPDELRSHAPEVPEGLARAVHHALAKQPEARFASAVEMAQALAPFADARSAQVLAWLLGGRGRSLVPAGLASFRPADATAVARPDEATAKTSLAVTPVPGAPGATDAAVASERPAPSAALAPTRRWVLLGATAFAVLGVAVGLGQMRDGAPHGATAAAPTIAAPGRADLASSPSSETRASTAPSPTLPSLAAAPSGSAVTLAALEDAGALALPDAQAVARTAAPQPATRGSAPASASSASADPLQHMHRKFQ